MGGDYAPTATVAGAVEAMEYEDLRVLLVGDRSQLQVELAKRCYDPSRIEIVHASERVDMGENPARAMRRKKDASAVVAARLVKNGQATGLVNAGNTGAAMSIALLVIGRIKGVDRPPICSYIPSRSGKVLLLDAGANVNCKPEQLLKFAIMGDIFSRAVTGKERPRVGLLNIGGEEGKGDDLTVATYDLLNKSDLNFIGNIEGNEIFTGQTDVVICDGFAGNVVLKVAEGMADFIVSSIRNEFKHRPLALLGAPFFLPPINAFKRKVDYKEYGGALLLGINGVCVIAHGRSDAKAIKNALRVARDAAAQDVVGRISRVVGKNPEPEESKGSEEEREEHHHKAPDLTKEEVL